MKADQRASHASGPQTIVNVGYKSTNYWVISAGRSRLLVDLGWPGTIGTMRANLTRAGVPIDEIKYAVATHYHIDHAGLAQDLKLAGIPLLVIDLQVPAIPLMRKHIKPQDNFTEISLQGNVTIALAESRALLQRIGIGGEILHTPGHSDDSVSVLLDDGSVFTGDLTHPALIGEDDSDIVRASWKLLWTRGAKRVHGGHGAVYWMPSFAETD